MNKFDQICAHCGCSRGSHLGEAYNSYFYGQYFPADYCPGHEGRMDWDKGPGTTFKFNGDYKETNHE